jgi:hypothetical protein
MLRSIVNGGPQLPADSFDENKPDFSCETQFYYGVFFRGSYVWNEVVISRKVVVRRTVRTKIDNSHD